MAELASEKVEALARTILVYQRHAHHLSRGSRAKARSFLYQAKSNPSLGWLYLHLHQIREEVGLE